MALEDDIEKTKEKLRDTPVNKSTETERGRLKAKIARLKEEKEQKQKESQASGQGYAVKQRGDATVSLVGPPSVGKSTLLNKLTNADSEVAGYEFTTLEVIPGMMEYKGANIQILDVPGLISGAAEDKGGGKQVLSVVRSSDMVVLVADSENINRIKDMREELYGSGIRLNEKPPNMDVFERGEGGIEISTTEDVDLEEETMKEVLKDHGFVNCKVVVREDLSLDEFIDGLMNNRVYMPGIVCLNKTDEIDDERLAKMKEERQDWVFVSAEESENLGEFKKRLWEGLGMMRIYMKKRGKEPDREEPLIVKRKSTVEDIMESLDKKFSKDLKYAKIWGGSAKFPGQKVGEDHRLRDEDVVELRF
ncbi:MAG: OBG GTPase family GTP-binding protein [Candidatus Aenigmatarchaeota archaeon]